MRYVPLPGSVMPSVFIGTLLFLAWLGWESYRAPETWWAPGDLSRAHVDVGSCLHCHQPFKGAVSRNCVACHGETQFFRTASPEVATAHAEVLRRKGTCLACHTEHRGVLAPITIGALHNPHGEFIFRATGARTCGVCHIISPEGGQPSLRDNQPVRQLLEQGKGAHRRRRMADCLRCHAGGVTEVGQDGNDR
ncbi:MULTIHEME_CYTC domain-containing protein [Nitrospira tepida]|uniref:MULTIHEME_CYTC domain-containing protein n=1 Tax=Nitrospira tepida TaxID=2973512 RepID=A0AA86N3G5_9BACT|nr:cytochrome c3 family protein [Nitrospira tepida]CAI4033912.1 MULTIHEME_CYTC domain-containing protein [Nitrospira tepida]